MTDVDRLEAEGLKLHTPEFERQIAETLAERECGMAGPSRDDLIAFVSKNNRALRHAGCNLAEAALRVIRDYDGIHRLALAVGEWTTAVANEGGRGAAEVRDGEATR